MYRVTNHTPTPSGEPQNQFGPPTDVLETEAGFEIRMELAGIDPAQTQAEVGPDNRTVTVTGVRLAPDSGPVRLLNLEIQYGPFTRQVCLPVEVEGQGAEASYVDGFLVIRLPKKERPVERRRIPIDD
ncbi:Hsp20/alpha crystallin family protein [bacterium]|nr:Hsp20/alpha crystallin family protein [bacterium]